METKDLILKNWQECDAEALYKMCCDKILRKSGIHFYTSVIESQYAIHSWKNNKGFNWDFIKYALVWIKKILKAMLFGKKLYCSR